MTPRDLKILYVGNYELPFCTEVHLASSLERCGHQVIRHQEQRQGVIDLRLVHEAWDLMLWTRTWRGYVTQQFLDACKGANKKTVSYHLDLYLGLRREADMDGDFFWRSQYVFTPDGDPISAKIFADRGINHFYMPPGVFAPECKKGNWKKHLAHDVTFVGTSLNYHIRDWPYRTQLVDFLKVRYADRFAVWGHPNPTMRNQDLNDLYASAKVAVGDSLCKNFTHENYWSDRIYETTGRGGFIIHPYIKGLENSFHIRGKTDGPEELVTYNFGDFEQLGRLIDHYVEHDSAREEIRDRGHERTKREHTYDQRIKKMLEIVCA
jgi:hypothetical protein